MKILNVPDQSWSAVLECDRCHTKFEADESDLDYDVWKTSGFWFDQSAVTENRFSVKCPSCPDSWVRVQDGDVPVLLQDRLREGLRKKRADRGY